MVMALASANFVFTLRKHKLFTQMHCLCYLMHCWIYQ